MKEIVEKIKSLIKELETENGPLLICALFLRDEGLERWDLIVSASWLKSAEMQSYKIVSSKLQKFLKEKFKFTIKRGYLLRSQKS